MKSSFFPKKEQKIVNTQYTGQKSLQFFVRILGETMTLSIHSEINWPLHSDEEGGIFNGFQLWSLVSIITRHVYYTIYSKVNIIGKGISYSQSKKLLMTKNNTYNEFFWSLTLGKNEKAFCKTMFLSFYLSKQIIQKFT